MIRIFFCYACFLITIISTVLGVHYELRVKPLEPKDAPVKQIELAFFFTSILFLLFGQFILFV